MKLSERQLSMLRDMSSGPLWFIAWTRNSLVYPVTSSVLRADAMKLIKAGYAERVGPQYALTDAGRELVRKHTPVPSRSFVNASQHDPLIVPAWTPPRGASAPIASRGWA